MLPEVLIECRTVEVVQHVASESLATTLKWMLGEIGKLSAASKKHDIEPLLAELYKAKSEAADSAAARKAEAQTLTDAQASMGNLPLSRHSHLSCNVRSGSHAATGCFSAAHCSPGTQGCQPGRLSAAHR